MCTRPGRLNSRPRQRPLYIKKCQYLAYHKLVSRDTPNNVYETQSYITAEGNLSTRKRALVTAIPIGYEIHLAGPSVTASINSVVEYGIKVTVGFNIYGSTRTLLDNRRSGCLVLLFDAADTQEGEWPFFVMTWKDLRINQSGSCSRTEDGHSPSWVSAASNSRTKQPLRRLSNRVLVDP
jgi:hypothetical protein